VLARDRHTGTLRRRRRLTPCPAPMRRCTAGDLTLRGMSLSPDGRYAYVAWDDDGNGGRATYARRAGGALLAVSPPRGCLAAKPAPGCDQPRGFGSPEAGSGGGPVFSPDGRDAYVPTQTKDSSASREIRRPATSRSYPAPPAAPRPSRSPAAPWIRCSRPPSAWSSHATAAMGTPSPVSFYPTTAPKWSRWTAIRPRGRWCGSGACPTRRVRAAMRCEGLERGCRRTGHLNQPDTLIVSPDRRSVYVVNIFDGGSTEHGDILVLAANRRTGALRPLPGRAGCLDHRGRHCTHSTASSS